MSLSYVLPIVLAILAIIAFVVVVISTVDWDSVAVATIAFVLTCYLTFCALYCFISVYQNRKAVENGTDMYQIEIGEKVYEEELFKAGCRYYDTDRELRFRVDGDFLIIYEDGKKVGASSNYIIHSAK